MQETKPLFALIRFGIFELDFQTGELRRQGHKVKLQEQPFQILLMLLQRPGESVTREELQKRLWPADTFVDFERGLNRAINKLRESLGDDADNPRFIETLPRRGYRFVAPVDTAAPREPEPAASSRLLVVPPLPPASPQSDRGSRKAKRSRQTLPWAFVGVTAMSAAFGYLKQWGATGASADRPILQFELDVGPDEFSQPAISPDGMRVVFVSKGGLAMRRLDQTKATRLAGTEAASAPFFSPSGRWVAFFGSGKLQKVALEGGVPVALCRAPDAGGGSWVDDDNIIASLDQVSLSLIPAAGGTPQVLANSRQDSSDVRMYYWPQMLPGGNGVLFSALSADARSSLRIFTPSDGKVRTVVENSTRGRYIAGGYLVYYQQGSLFAAPMDIRRLELSGSAVPLLPGGTTGGKFDPGQFDLSNSGTLVYREGTAGASMAVCWLHPSGRTEPVFPKPGSYSSPRLSPDGSRLAIPVINEGEQKLWIYDFRRETWTRLTSDSVRESHPTWTPDGKYIAFRSGTTLAWTRSDGSGTVEHLSGVSDNVGPASFSADGKWLTFWPLQPGSDLWIVPVERTPGSLRLGQPQPLLQQPGSKGAPRISPDNRWVAYSSSESGRFEIYVMPMSPKGKAAGGKWPVSNEGGISPVWSQRSRELFYQGLDRRIHVVGYTQRGDAFVPAKPRVWSETRLGGKGLLAAFDPAPDGKRVLAMLPAEDPRPETLVHVVLNIDSKLRPHARAGSK